MKTAIVISDLRVQPIAAALSLQEQFENEQPALLVSVETIWHRDFGQVDNPFVRYIKVALLRWLHNLRVVQSNGVEDVENDCELKGVWSSLHSITNDSMASKEVYPRLWASLVALHNGAKATQRYIERHEFERVCLFNGRLASSYAIAKYAQANGLIALYYEFARSNLHRKYFTLTPFPTHNLKQWGEELLKFSKRNTIPIPTRYQLAENFRRSKLNNVFTKSYKYVPRQTYDVVVFLSSSHEYKALDSEICDVEMKSELEVCKSVVERYGTANEYAVRCHPNMTKDPSCKQQLEKLAAYCRQREIDLYEPYSEVSSYELIKSSKKVVVDLSSIAVEAIILGGDVEIIGDSTPRVVYDAVCEEAECRGEPDDVRDSIICILALAPRLYQEPFKRAGVRWLKGNRLLEELGLVSR